jgi:hypothetical protein
VIIVLFSGMGHLELRLDTAGLATTEFPPTTTMGVSSTKHSQHSGRSGRSHRSGRSGRSPQHSRHTTTDGENLNFTQMGSETAFATTMGATLSSTVSKDHNPRFYDLVRFLGEGGGGSTFLADFDGREVVVKMVCFSFLVLLFYFFKHF